jgi:hypothetical protein
MPVVSLDLGSERSFEGTGTMLSIKQRKIVMAHCRATLSFKISQSCSHFS